METYHGCVRTPADAIKLFEACRIGLLPRVQRRLSEKERQSIKSGSVFVWDEREAGMRRWTDGKSWSASRVSGSFLTYREMEGKRGGGYGTSRRTATRSPPGGRSNEDPEAEPECYRYKTDGLTKQSFSITTSQGQHLHLISYYSRTLPGEREPPQPSADPNLRHITPMKGMYPESSLQEPTPPVLTRTPMQPYGNPQRPQEVYVNWPQQPWAPPLPPSPNHTPPHWANGKYETEQSPQAYLPPQPPRAPHFSPPANHPQPQPQPQPQPHPHYKQVSHQHIAYLPAPNEHGAPASQSQQLQAQAAQATQAVMVGPRVDNGRYPPQGPYPAMPAPPPGGCVTPPRTTSLSPTQPPGSDAYRRDSPRKGSLSNILLHPPGQGTPEPNASANGSNPAAGNNNPCSSPQDPGQVMSEQAIQVLNRKFYI
ncbi:Gti1/Pac2 family-domain-containing protein [Xylaria intraflava]|nr:Gti1/Pac2 family-domain-containing protein [Xylaria intraflava]